MVPAKTAVKSISNKNRGKLTLSWKKVSEAKGYEIYRKIGKTGKYKKIKTITKNSTVKYTNTKLKKGTAYYYRVRSYTIDANGKKVFGEWSNGFQFSVTTTTPDAPVITSVKVSGSTIKVTYKAAANATGYDVVLGTSSKKDNGETRPYNYGAHKKLNLKEGTVTATFKKVPKGTWVVGMHAFNRTSEDGKKVFSPWSNLKTATVK